MTHFKYIGAIGHFSRLLDADLEMKFNESFVDPQTRFHIVCKIRSKKSRSRSQTSEPINLIFSLKGSIDAFLRCFLHGMHKFIDLSWV